MYTYVYVHNVCSLNETAFNLIKINVSVINKILRNADIYDIYIYTPVACSVSLYVWMWDVFVFVAF